MTHGSLFSGIGGFDLAAEWMGWQNVFHCEWNTFGQKVLKHYWSDAISYNDITKTDFTIHRGRIDILTGGFPCQPYSMAGKRLGKEDDRHLWPEMLRAIREIQPRWVVGENVLGLVNWSNGLVFHEVQADLEAEGYEVQPFVLPAVSVNAPHRRDRVWFVAHAKDLGSTVCKLGEKKSGKQIQAGGYVDRFESMGTTPHPHRNPTGTSREGGGVETDWGADDVQSSEWREQAEQHNRPSSFSWDAADTNPTRCENWDKQHRGQQAQNGEGQRCTCGYCIGINKSNVTHSHRNGQHGSDSEHEKQSSEGREYAQRDFGESNDNGDAADTDGIGRRENERKRNRKSNVINKNGTATNWETFPTVSPICDGNDGISDRLDGITFPKWRQESIKAGGNAIVPQVVLQIFRTIEYYEKTHAQ